MTIFILFARYFNIRSTRFT